MDVYAEPRPLDGERLLLVAMELVMALFCCLCHRYFSTGGGDVTNIFYGPYAYPHVPSRILDGGNATVWFSIGSLEALRQAITNLLHESAVIQTCQREAGTTRDQLTYAILCASNQLDRTVVVRVGVCGCGRTQPPTDIATPPV